jgi:two-component system chemotaxis sensor kinase CheA
MREAWPKLAELDAYRNVLDFHLLSIATREELEEDFRYVVDQIKFSSLSHFALVRPQGDPNGGPVYEDFVADALGYLDDGNIPALQRAAAALLELSNPDLWLSSALRWLLLIIEKEPEAHLALRAMVESLTTLQAPDWAALARQGTDPTKLTGPGKIQETTAGPVALTAGLADPIFLEMINGVLSIQRSILTILDNSAWQGGRIQAASATVAACLKSLGDLEGLAGWNSEVASALEGEKGTDLVAWLDQRSGHADTPTLVKATEPRDTQLPPTDRSLEPGASQEDPRAEGEVKFRRRAEDSQGPSKSLKVDQVKIDRLMNLIGEMIVSKNALPYLAARAENVFGVRELSREIKAQYAVINRISDEMQDAIMQVRMMPASFVFQRFPRLVRDTSRKLGKEVNLVLVGEETEADKNIIEALGDPLVHIVRNSLDHGFEMPDVRLAAGKPVAGTLTITATQESDRVVIEIKDDGKGIDPVAIKQKAYERGIIDEGTLDRISDHDAINLIFAPGLSTAEVVSDLSGRGVGMDVVRTVIEKLNGSIHLESERGLGTCLHLSLPLSMAVTNVVIVEADGQTFGLPMDSVVETVRIPRSGIWSIKNQQATVLRGRTMALKSLNELLGLSAAPKTNAEGEAAVIVVRMNGEQVGLLVDSFHETVDVILKPMTGILNGLSAYAGSALMGDGSVLIILNVKELL